MKLFVLDNDEDFRREWIELLRRAGHHVDESTSPDERTPADVHAHNYDLAIIDLRATCDNMATDKSGQVFAVALCKYGTPAIVMTGFPLSAKEMSSLLREGTVAGFVLKSLSMWELLALLDQYNRYHHFPNGIVKFNRSDKKKDMGAVEFWRSVQAELAPTEKWSLPQFKEFSLLFRNLVPPCADSVSIRSVRRGTSGASLLRAKVSYGDAPVTEDLAIKFGDRNIILDEMMRYDRYVGPLPDGTATQLRYRAQTQHLAAIAYSWVGDSLEEGLPVGSPGVDQASKVTWDRRRSTICRLFSRSLNGWYKVYRNSTPTHPESVSLLEYYLHPGGVWADGLESLYTLELPFSGSVEEVDKSTWSFGSKYGRLKDPRWWAHSGKGSELTFSRQCPIHGDLHVNNVYILPDGSPRLIDFGRTSVGQVFRDFAAIEVSLRLTCVEKTEGGGDVDAESLAKMEDIICSADIGGLAGYLDFRKTYLDGEQQKSAGDIVEAIRTTMAIRRAALDAMGAQAEERALEHYLFAVTIHMLRYAAGDADEVRKPEHGATRTAKNRWKNRKKLREWHALYGAACAATQATHIANGSEGGSRNHLSRDVW